MTSARLVILFAAFKSCSTRPFGSFFFLMYLYHALQNQSSFFITHNKMSLRYSANGHAIGSDVHVNAVSPQRQTGGEEDILIVPSNTQHDCDRVDKDGGLEANLRA